STVNTLTYTYDTSGDRLTAADASGAYTMGYDVLNRMTSQQGPLGQALTATYDANGHRTLVRYADGGVTTPSYEYSSGGWLTDRYYSAPGLSQALRLQVSWNRRGQLYFLKRIVGSTIVGDEAYGYFGGGQVNNVAHQDAAGNDYDHDYYTIDL